LSTSAANTSSTPPAITVVSRSSGTLCISRGSRRRPNFNSRVDGAIFPAFGIQQRLSLGLCRSIGVEPDGAQVPLWGLTEAVRLSGLSGPPYELQDAVADLEVATIEIGKTRDWTDPLDLVRENFPYLS